MYEAPPKVVYPHGGYDEADEHHLVLRAFDLTPRGTPDVGVDGDRVEGGRGGVAVLT